MRPAAQRQGAEASSVVTNFETDRSPAEFADLYAKRGLRGGHVIMLGPGNESAALAALAAFRGGLQVGGGITADNCRRFLDAGASHVIVTSYVFSEGRLDTSRLEALVEAAGGPDRVVIDLSCRRKPSAASPPGPEETDYFVVTDRWQRFTDLRISRATLEGLKPYCAELLVHGVDVEGKQSGVEESLVESLGEWSPLPVTYAGGCRSLDDINTVHALGRGRVNVSIGSAMDTFGGPLSLDDVIDRVRALNKADESAAGETAAE
ncbi:hypothetical protein FNF28_06391 [Cafeteria roenbergensis]|uniref:1-(5-phosphoribosyl)-5-[(5-phosphoribosylamino)methylideneamino]imidazole-4-carboxamideisomerase n=1 Tax=Cafeteria roenbergensis TaxID=33653 RepID=A0A5A8D2F9_CAFRO|nr:hypothetical protein FNF28_06391 [Cafeteria roenbergensis]